MDCWQVTFGPTPPWADLRRCDQGGWEHRDTSIVRRTSECGRWLYWMLECLWDHHHPVSNVHLQTGKLTVYLKQLFTVMSQSNTRTNLVQNILQNNLRCVGYKIQKQHSMLVGQLSIMLCCYLECCTTSWSVVQFILWVDCKLVIPCSLWVKIKQKQRL